MRGGPAQRRGGALACERKQSLQKTMERDEQKRAKCLANNCILIHVDERYEYSNVESAVQQAITIQQKLNSSLNLLKKPPKKGALKLQPQATRT